MSQVPLLKPFPLGTTPTVKPLLLTSTSSLACETHLNIGFFFDGTCNNKDWNDGKIGQKGGGTQLQQRAESNVARLFFAYPQDHPHGYYAYYVPGVGTPFHQIGELEGSTTGAAFANGGAGRIKYARLVLLNTLYRSTNSTSGELFNLGERLSLCSSDAPLTDSASYNSKVQQVTQLVANSKKPRIKHVYVDIFGFSRGAAEARVFCAWLDRQFNGKKLFGAETTIRFLGLFDTVASVGAPNLPTLTNGLTDGHFAWATPDHLKVPARVVNCLHLVAMHENRTTFPCDRVAVDGVLPSNCMEFAFPGMHSDVGGGYGLVEQGRGMMPIKESKNTLDSEKLSQISLKAMLKVAQKAKVPLDVGIVQQASGLNAYDPFAVADNVRQAYEAFHQHSMNTPRQEGDWLMPYLAWRYQVRHSYTKEPWHKRAMPAVAKQVTGANEMLLRGIETLEQGFWEDVGDGLLHASPVVDAYELHHNELGIFAPEAPDVLARMKSHPKISEAEAHLFKTYVHDSIAGFKIAGIWEPEGYIRYRRFYMGGNTARTYVPQTPPVADRPIPTNASAAGFFNGLSYM